MFLAASLQLPFVSGPLVFGIVFNPSLATASISYTFDHLVPFVSEALTLAIGPLVFGSDIFDQPVPFVLEALVLGSDIFIRLVLFVLEVLFGSI